MTRGQPDAAGTVRAMVRLRPVTKIGLVLTAVAVLAGGALLAWLDRYHGPDPAAANWELLRSKSLLANGAGALVAARTYDVALIPAASTTRAMWVFLAGAVASLLLASARYGMRPALPSGREVIARTCDGTAGSVISMLTGLAVVIAGPKHGVRADEWAGDTQEAADLAKPRSWQVREAARRVRAAILIRAESDIAPHLDAVLSSRWRSLLILGILFAAPVTMVISREGIYGLVMNAENLAVIGGLLYAALRALRRWRGISPSRGKQRDREH